MNDVFVSIVIPVYNVALYIEKCMESVLNQTYEKIEILVVDDCGTDDSMDIVEKLISEYSGNKIVKILHHDHNRGLSAARNTGIIEAKGDFIYFLDSDDTISVNTIFLLRNYIDNNSSIDMVIGNYRVINDPMPSLLMLSEGYYQEDILNLYCEKKIYTMAWNKLVRRKFLLDNNLFFEEGLIHEDNLWSFMVACHLKSIAVCSKITYDYQIRPNSIQQEKNAFVKHQLAYQKVTELMTEYAHKTGTINDRSVFYFVDTYQCTYIMFPLWNNIPELSCCFYHVLRSLPRLSIFQLLRFGRSFKEKLSCFHFLFPEKLGFKWYVKFRKS